MHPHFAIWCYCVDLTEHGQENTAAIISNTFLKGPWNHPQRPWTGPQLENVPHKFGLNGGKL